MRKGACVAFQAVQFLHEVERASSPGVAATAKMGNIHEAVAKNLQVVFFKRSSRPPPLATHFENDLAARVALAVQLQRFVRVGKRKLPVDVDAKLALVGELAQRAEQLAR